MGRTWENTHRIKYERHYWKHTEITWLKLKYKSNYKQNLEGILQFEYGTKGNCKHNTGI